MKCMLDIKPESLHLFMEGTFTFKDASKFKHMLTAILAERDRQEVYFDMSNLDFIDSTALSLMMFAHDLAKKLHLLLIFEKPKGQVHDFLQNAAEYNNLNIS